MATMGMLIDVLYCGGCNQCVEACKKKQGFGGDPQKTHELSATARCATQQRGEFTVRKLCRHCIDPCCVSACPADALTRTETGAVTYDAGKCMGCRYCMISCPFDIPRYEWDEVAPKIQKCDMCFDRIAAGEIPACAEACDQEATIFGEREELLRIARERIADDPDEYDPHICGEFDEGGAAILMIGPKGIGPLRKGCHECGVSKASIPRSVLKEIPGFGVAGAAAMLAVWFTRRRDEVRAAEGRGRNRSRSQERPGPDVMEV